MALSRNNVRLNNSTHRHMIIHKFHSELSPINMYDVTLRTILRGILITHLEKINIAF